MHVVHNLEGEDLRKAIAAEEVWGMTIEEAALWRLSKDLLAAKEEGWGEGSLGGV